VNSISHTIAAIVNKWFPDFKHQLYVSGINKTVKSFVEFSFLISLLMSAVIVIILGIFLRIIERPWDETLRLTAITFAICFILFFIVIFRIPAYNIKRLAQKIEGEVAVTGRRLLIQLESGKSLVNSILDIARHEKVSSKSLEIVAYELYMGKPLEQAIRDAIRNSPSETFKKIFIQIRNSLKTGADLKHTLRVTLEDITKEKMIEFQTFGKKINTLGLFYMIFGTIGPSLGVVAFVVLLALLKVKITLVTLSAFLVVVFITQMLFIAIFSRMRPLLEI
jgi:pilus assembly protein TadC